VRACVPALSDGRPANQSYRHRTVRITNSDPCVRHGTRAHTAPVGMSWGSHCSRARHMPAPVHGKRDRTGALVLVPLPIWPCIYWRINTSLTNCVSSIADESNNNNNRCVQESMAMCRPSRAGLVGCSQLDRSSCANDTVGGTDRTRSSDYSDGTNRGIRHP
jgi:hypothetical protein